MEKLIFKIWELSQLEENKDGFTFYLPSLERPQKGWIIANVATQFCFGFKGLQKAFNHAWAYNRIIGGWFEEDKTWFDASFIESKEQNAIALMKVYNQKMIYEIDTGKFIVNEDWRA